jgi:heterodisulfide reductase subunit C
MNDSVSYFSYVFQILLFVALLGATALLVYRRFKAIRRNILLGRDLEMPENKTKGLGKVLEFAIAQRKMFARPIVGLLHYLIFAGFVLINSELLEIVLDGLTGSHRLFAGFLPTSLYQFLIDFYELMGFFVVVACVVFLVRRNVLKIERFQKPEMKGWPSLDGNLILIFEVILMFFLFTMNATDSILQMRQVSHYAIFESPMRFLVSQFFIPLYSDFSDSTLTLIERTAWWAHISGIFAFGVYVTYSKHLHIIMAFPNTYYTRLQAKGKVENMKSVTQEVKIALGIAEPDPNADPNAVPERFGAKDATDLTWKNLMDAYACTECGRCTDSCPANLTGKKLSPRKIMMDTRDRIEEIGAQIDKLGENYQHDGKFLYGDYVSKEELLACTTCNACVEACPISISPLDIIMQMRNYVAMEEASVPDSWKSMLTNVSNNGAPWAFPASDRFNWAQETK